MSPRSPSDPCATCGHPVSKHEFVETITAEGDEYTWWADCEVADCACESFEEPAEATS